MPKFVYRHNKPVNKISREELANNLENARQAFKEFQNRINETIGIKAQLGNLNKRMMKEMWEEQQSLTILINKLKGQKKGRTSSETALEYRVALKKLRKLMPSEKGYNVSSKGKEWGRPNFEQYVKNYTEDLWGQYRTQSEKTNPHSSAFLETARIQTGATDNEIRAFLNSELNIDLSHVEYESEGLKEFYETYGVSLQTARFLDFMGYDYKAVGATGEFTKKVIVGR